MGTYTFEKGKDGKIRRFRNGAFQETATNSELQLLKRIEELEGFNFGLATESQEQQKHGFSVTLA